MASSSVSRNVTFFSRMAAEQVLIPRMKVQAFTRPAVQTTVYIVQRNHGPRGKHRVQLKSLEFLEGRRRIYFLTILRTAGDHTEVQLQILH